MAKDVWEIKKRLSYVKVGIFFLTGLMILFIALISIKDVTFFMPGQEVKVIFEFAEGIKRASPVRFCGVDVGEVREVTVLDSPKGPRVQVRVNIERGINIPRDSYFFINSLSLFGEKYIEITPPAELSGYIKAGETVKGISPVPLFQLFAGFSKTMEELRNFIEEGDLRSTLEQTVINLEGITSETKELILDIKEQKGTVGRLLYDDSLYRRTEEFLLDIQQNPWKLLHKPRERGR